MKIKKVLAIPDTHFPFANIKKLTNLYSLCADLKPDVIVQLGDLMDMFSYSKYARSHNLMTPKHELREGHEMAKNFWINLQKNAPKAQCVQLTGNHDMRISKRVLEKAPELEHLVSLKDYFEFKNVKTLLSDKDYLEVDGVIYLHGFLTRLGDHAKYFGKSVVHGHTHRAGVLFLNQYGGKSIFELDCGLLASRDEVPLQYGATKHNNWVEGCGVVDEFGPRFVVL